MQPVSRTKEGTHTLGMAHVKTVTVHKNSALTGKTEHSALVKGPQAPQVEEEIAQQLSEQLKTTGQEEQAAEKMAEQVENLSISVIASEQGVSLEVRDAADERLIMRLPIEDTIESHGDAQKLPGALVNKLL